MTSDTPADPLVEVLRIALLGRETDTYMDTVEQTGAGNVFVQGVVDLTALAAAVRGAAIVKGVSIAYVAGAVPHPVTERPCCGLQNREDGFDSRPGVQPLYPLDAPQPEETIMTDEVSPVASIGLQRYRCHKIVQALKIGAIEFDADGSANISTPNGILFVTKPGFRERYHVDIYKDDFGYLVIYEDGYQSWSPTKAFEEGYTLIAGDRSDGSDRTDADRLKSMVFACEEKDGEIADLKEALDHLRNKLAEAAPQREPDPRFTGPVAEALADHIKDRRIAELERGNRAFATKIERLSIENDRLRSQRQKLQERLDEAVTFECGHTFPHDELQRLAGLERAAQVYQGTATYHDNVIGAAKAFAAFLRGPADAK